MKSCNDHSHDDESQDKDDCNYPHNNLNYLSRKRQISTLLSFDVEREKDLNHSTTENTKATKQLKKQRHNYSSNCKQALDEAKRKGRCQGDSNATQITESKMMPDVLKGIQYDKSNTQCKRTNSDSKSDSTDSHSVATFHNNSQLITLIFSYNGINQHSDRHLSNKDNCKVDIQGLLNNTYVKEQQDTNLQVSHVEDTICQNEILQHHINTLRVCNVLPYLAIEVGEPLPLVSSSAMSPDVRRDFPLLPSPFDPMALNSMNRFSSSLQTTPSTNVLLNNLTRSSDHLLSLLTLQNIRSTVLNPLIVSNPFAWHILAQERIPTPSMSRASLPFGPPSQHICSHPWSEIHALLNANDSSRFRSCNERINSSNRISIPHSLVLNEDNHSNLIPSQILRVNDTIDGAHATDIVQQDSTSSESVSLSMGGALQHSFGTQAIEARVPQCLPFIIALPDDTKKLSSLQVLLRQQIEFFSASADDLLGHTRGRNKAISLKQVGIRCKHCANLALNRRKKGSVYFPFTLLGIYQAAQNMASTHFLKENCHENLSDLKLMIIQFIGYKSIVGFGKDYWADAARHLGLLDSDLGIRFIRDLELLKVSKQV